MYCTLSGGQATFRVGQGAWGWRTALAETGVQFLSPRSGDSHLPMTPTLGDLTPSSGSIRNCTHMCTHPLGNRSVGRGVCHQLGPGDEVEPQYVLENQEDPSCTPKTEQSPQTHGEHRCRRATPAGVEGGLWCRALEAPPFSSSMTLASPDFSPQQFWDLCTPQADGRTDLL